MMVGTSHACGIPNRTLARRKRSPGLLRCTMWSWPVSILQTLLNGELGGQVILCVLVAGVIIHEVWTVRMEDKDFSDVR